MRSDDDSSSPSVLLYDVMGSAAAGIISRIITHPLDTVRLLFGGMTLSYCTSLPLINNLNSLFYISTGEGETTSTGGGG